MPTFSLSPAATTALAFNAALNAGDLEAAQALLADDTVYENTYPAPDGTRLEGKAAVGAFWAEFLRASRAPHIEPEEVLACGDRVVLRWRYAWLTPAGQPQHIRGVDVFKIRDGLIVEKLSYVKG